MIRYRLDDFAISKTPNLRLAQTQIVTAACAGLGLAVLLIIGGWAVTGTLEDWETVVAGGVLIAILAGLAFLAQRGHPSLAAGLLAGLLFAIILADMAYYGLGSPSAAALVIPVLLIACTLGLRPGLAAAAIGAALAFLIAWASLNGVIETTIDANESHLSFNAPIISVILLFSAGLAGTAAEAYKKL